MAAGAMQSEAELMRECGHLYASIALESLSTTLLALFFSYLLLLITNKGRLQNPGHAAWSFAVSNLKTFFKELWEEVKDWQKMPHLPLERRFAFCRKVNQAVCLFQILIAVLTIERWLHINNVNGFRYLGYSITCPPMQTELIVLIAPAMRCYKLNVITTYILTMVMLWAGYAASVLSTQFYDGSFTVYLETMDLGDLKPNAKFYFALVAMVIQMYLSFLQIPTLFLTYCCSGMDKMEVPLGYGKLLLNVSISWLAFPVWWLLSYEGMNTITDTKMNATGFCLLNILAKGSFTLMMLAMSRNHRKMLQQKEYLEKGRKPSTDSQGALFGPTSNRRESRKETWVVKVLRPFDNAGAGLGAEVWEGLETTYRAYLVGIGMRGKRWNQMSVADRLALRKGYDSTQEEIQGKCGDDPEEVEAVGNDTKGLRDTDEPAPAPPEQDDYWAGTQVEHPKILI